MGFICNNDGGGGGDCGEEDQKDYHQYHKYTPEEIKFRIFRHISLITFFLLHSIISQNILSSELKVQHHDNTCPNP